MDQNSHLFEIRSRSMSVRHSAHWFSGRGRAPSRPAFSLMEVMVAMAICVLGLAMILQITGLSQSFAQKALEATELQILAQNRMSEVVASIRPIEEIDEEECPENDQAFYSLSWREHNELDLVEIDVTVWFASKTDRSASLSSEKRETRRQDSSRDRGREYKLTRWLHVPKSTPNVQSKTIERDGAVQ